MPRSFRWKIPLLVVVLAFACLQTFPLAEKINLGLDLQGGMHLVLKVDTSELPPATNVQDVTEVALEVIRNRIDQFGVREPLIQRQGIEHILVQLPGITDRDRALKLIGQTALLEFRLVSESQRLIQRALDGTVPRGYELLEDVQGTPYLLEIDGGLTGSVLSNAGVEPGQFGYPLVNFSMTREGARQFGRLTGSNINRRMAIVLDGVVQSAPTIQSRITDAGQITGQFSSQEAHDLAIVLRAGALPAPIIIEEERTIGPSLGRDSIQAGTTAIAIGGALVVAFMLGYYWLAGLIATIALLLNVLFVLGGLGYFSATLTLPGIAGMILTLGMAVDANVLIYERIREELREGRVLSQGIAIGYQKAFSAIIDSNVTTLVAAFFLYWFGTGPIRGFATTLGIGILASLFTTLFVTRLIFDMLLCNPAFKRLTMLQLVKPTKFDFIGKRFLCWGLSLVAIVIGMTAFTMRGPDRYGIDFTGGLLQEYRFTTALSSDEVRSTLRDAGVEDAKIQEFGAPTEWLIQTPDDTEEKIARTTAAVRTAFHTEFAQASPELVRLERVGPTVGAILRKKAWLAIVWSLMGILFYVSVRFRHFDFGLAALVALTHDVIIAAGALMLMGRQIDLVIVAALLTVAGYSVNDTIVVYDRVRENERLHPKLGLIDLLNLSVNQTLSRTLLTSLTTLLVVGVLYAVGGEALRDFSFVLIIGFMTGVYSSIYIASGFVVLWRQLFAPRTT